MPDWDYLVKDWDIQPHPNGRTSIRFIIKDITNPNYSGYALIEMLDSDIPRLVNALDKYAKSINA